MILYSSTNHTGCPSCGSLNENGWPHRFIRSEVFERTRHCCLDRAGVVFWRKCATGDELSGFRNGSLSLASACLSSNVSVCLPAFSHASYHENHGLNLRTVSCPQLNVFCYNSCLSTAKETLTKTLPFIENSQFTFHPKALLNTSLALL